MIEDKKLNFKNLYHLYNLYRELWHDSEREIAELKRLLKDIWEDTGTGQESMSHDIRQRIDKVLKEEP